MSKTRNYEHLSKEMSERIRYDREQGIRPNFAADGSKALRRDMSSDRESAWRPAYLRDVDKILHSPYYNRYTDKTQVFSSTAQYRSHVVYIKDFSPFVFK